MDEGVKRVIVRRVRECSMVVCILLSGLFSLFGATAMRASGSKLYVIPLWSVLWGVFWGAVCGAFFGHIVGKKLVWKMLSRKLIFAQHVRLTFSQQMII